MDYEYYLLERCNMCGEWTERTETVHVDMGHMEESTHVSTCVCPICLVRYYWKLDAYDKQQALQKIVA